jgi:hypothetical protein
MRRDEIWRSLGRIDRGIVALGLIGVVALCGAAAAFQSFAWFASHDDEGYMMMSVRHLLDGHRLYGDIRVPYGPLYYFQQWLLHGWLELPLTHTSGRLGMLLTRLATATVGAVTVVRLSRNLPMGIVAFCALCSHQLPLTAEPGHPQELGVLFAALVPLCASFVSARPIAMLLALGLLAAALAMIKVNLGVIALLATVLALLTVFGAVWRWLAVVGVLATVPLPWLLIAGNPPWNAFAAFVSACVAGQLPWSWPRCDTRLRYWWPLALCAGLSAGIALLLLAAIRFGASAEEVLRALVLDPRRAYGSVGHLPMPIPAIGVWTALGLAASVAVHTLRRRDSPWFDRAEWIAMLAVSTVAIWHLRGMTHQLPFFIGPWAWVILLREQSLARALVAWLTILSPLQAFPIPGSQATCGGLPAFICATVIFGDVIAASAALVGTARGRWVWRLAAIALLLLSIAWGWKDLAVAREFYANGDAVALPGTGPLHDGNAAQLRAMADAIRTRCDVLLTLPGYYSMNFWSAKPPPTVDLISHASRFVSDERLATIAARLDAAQAPCVLCRGTSVPCPGSDLWKEPPDPRIPVRILATLRPVEAWPPYTLYGR